ncbi:hypothetical protein GIB67_022487 [Kingdonia uniflora]|uniref:Uncharacterized protein n=1 Tax=Kingdonia uniflora TaxID=39325 RepID=A0A7J7L790_9MAGN|nr:hypothetical protein GIB67_022487 [Kingdonia uniflora]
MKKSSLLTTLFQSSGVAMNEQGFINVTKTVSGEIEFGSAVKGAPLTSKLVKMVAAQPYNISVLQISSPIVPTGIENANPNSTASPPHSASPATPPPSEGPAGPVAGKNQNMLNIFLLTKGFKAPAPTKASPSAPSESPSDSADAPSDNADVPSEADAPDVSDSPLNSPPMAIADEPAGDSDESPALVLLRPSLLAAHV